MGDPPDGPTENMVAIRGSGSPHFGFAGHLDVVPAGEGWSCDPFAAEIHDGMLVGRGANDMKSAIAAYVAAISRLGETGGTLSFLITGDEEGYAVLRHAAHHRLAQRTANPARHDPDRRADLGRPARRHGQDRPPRLGQYVDRSAGGSGACRLSAPRDQPDPCPRPLDQRVGSRPSRRRHGRIPRLEPRVHRDLHSDQREQCHPGLRHSPAQHPLQQSSEGRGPRPHGRRDRRARGAGRQRSPREFQARRS